MKKNNLIEAYRDLDESRRNLENLELFHKLHKMCKEGFINGEEFKASKTYIMTFGSSYLFKKADYERRHLEAIPILHYLLKFARITESQYHKAVMLVITAERDTYSVRYLRAGLINFDEFIDPQKSEFLKWLKEYEADALPAFGRVPANRIALELYEKYGFSVERIVKSFRKRIGIFMKRGDLHFEVRQSDSFFCGIKIYIIDSNKKKYSYDSFKKQFTNITTS